MSNFILWRPIEIINQCVQLPAMTVIIDDNVRRIEHLQNEGHRKEACLELLTLILHREDTAEIEENVDKLINAFREEGMLLNYK